MHSKMSNRTAMTGLTRTLFVALLFAGGSAALTRTVRAQQSCDDGNECTTIDSCQADGSCKGTNRPNGTACTPSAVMGDCVISAACQLGACVPVQTKPINTPCTNVLLKLCMTDATCQFGGFCFGETKQCPQDSDKCTLEMCDPQTGACISVSNDNCTSGCTTGQCNPDTGECMNTQNRPDGTACNDFNDCTSNDRCSNGECHGSTTIVATATSTPTGRASFTPTATPQPPTPTLSATVTQPSATPPTATATAPGVPTATATPQLTVAPSTATATAPGVPTSTATPQITPPASSCVGDCGGNNEVTVDELIKGVNIALGNLPVSDCPSLDANSDGEVTVNELIKGVNNALSGCPTPAPTETPTTEPTATTTQPGVTPSITPTTIPPTPTPTPTVPPTVTASTAPTATQTLAPTATHTAVATQTPTLASSPTATLASTSTPTLSVTATPTATGSAVATASATTTTEATQTPTETPQASPTLASTSTPTLAVSATPTATGSAVATASATTTVETTQTPTETPQTSPTQTVTATLTPTTGASVPQRAAGTIQTSTSGLLVLPNILSAILGHVGGSGAGSAAVVVIPVPFTCPGGGGGQVTCNLIGPPTYNITLNNCAVTGTGGTTLTFNGSIVANGKSGDSCLQIPSDVTVSIPSLTVISQASNGMTTTTFTNVTGSITLSGSNAACTYDTAKFSLVGTMTVTFKDAMNTTLGSTDVTFGQGSSIQIKVTQYGNNCVPTIYDSTVQGGITFKSLGISSAAIFTDYTLHNNTTSGNNVIAVSGGIESACLGTAVQLSTMTDLLVIGAAPCPHAGAVLVTAGNTTDLVSYTDSGGVQIDVGNNGGADQTFASCLDPALFQCPAS